MHVVDVAWRSTPATFAEQALLHAEQKLRERVEQSRNLQPRMNIHSTALLRVSMEDRAPDVETGSAADAAATTTR